jgi:hypothetical protein
MVEYILDLSSETWRVAAEHRHHSRCGFGSLLVLLFLFGAQLNSPIGYEKLQGAISFV